MATIIPRQDIPCSSTTTLSDCGITQSCTLAVMYVADHDNSNILELFDDEQVC